MKKIPLLVVILSLALVANAAPVGQQAAFDIAKNFFFNKGILLTQTEAAYKAPRRTGTTPADNSYYYIFNGDNGGYVIVSGDDRTEQIIGYSDNGHIDVNNMPENLRAWLQSYADQIKYLDDNNIQTAPETPVQKAMRRASMAHHSIAPLVSTRWNQGDPYNLVCPTYYNADGTSGRSVTGCTQTAFAQVLNFYKYPEVTKARIPAHTCTYELADGTKKSSTIKAIPAKTPIDWDNMCDNYYGNETDEQRHAVAQLMVLIGQSLKAGYGSSTGASFALAHTLLVNYLGYDDGVYVTNSDEYGIQEWADKVYNELALGYPVCFCGFSTGGGHAFVVDGFDGDDLFHLNWGWGGGSDGYFRLTVLNPGDNSGIGASSSADGYSMGQQAVFNLRPDDDGIEGGVETKPHMTIDGTTIDGTTITSRYINWTGATGSFHGAIVMENEDGVLAPVSDVKSAESLGANYLYTWSFNLKNRFKTPGTYRLTPASKLMSAKEYYPLYNLKTEYIEAVVDESLNVTLTKIEPILDLDITTWKFPGTLKAGDQQDVTVSIMNQGDEFKREVALYASKTENKGDAMSRAMVCVKEGEEDDFTFFFNPNETGTYNLWLTLSGKPDIVLGQTTVTISNVANNSASLKFSSLNVSTNGYAGRGKGTANFTNTGTKAFSGTIKLQLWKYDSTTNLCHTQTSCSASLAMEAGKSATAEFDFQDLEIGRTYFITASITSQSGNIADSGLIWNHTFETKSGLLHWNNNGVIGGAAQTTSYNISSVTCGILINNATFGTINPGRNPNTIYAVTEGTNVPAGLEGTNLVIGNEAEEINLVSEKTVVFPVSFTAKKATYTHTFTQACDGEKGYAVITLPFAPQSITIDGERVQLSQNGGEGNVYIKEFYEENDQNEVIFADVDVFRGGTPYIIGCAEELVGKEIVFYAENVAFQATDSDFMYIGSEHFGFNGTTYSPKLTNIYILNEEGSAFELFTGNKKAISGGYFTTKFSEEKRPESIRIQFTERITGINSVRYESSDDAVYDLTGRRVAVPSHGIYIVGGKKILK